MTHTCRFTLTAILVMACGEAPAESRELQDRVAELSHARLTPSELKAREVTADTLLGTPSSVEVLNDYLLLIVDALPPFFHLIHRQSGEVVSSFGVRGGGPGEFNSAVGVTLVKGRTGQFWAYDVERKFVTLVEIGKPPGPDGRILELKRIGYYNAPLAADDSVLFVLGDSDSSAVVRYDFIRGEARLIGAGMSFEPPADGPIPLRAERQLSTEVRMCAAPGNRYARFHRLSGRLELLDDGGQVRTASVPYSFEPVYQASPDHGYVVQLSTADQRSGYQECVASDRYVIALFAGRRWGSLSREQQSEFRNSSFIHVFSWEGELLGTARLSEPIVGMDLDVARMELFGVRYRPEPAVVVFDVRHFLRDFH
jgi:hypothetical protein